MKKLTAITLLAICAGGASHAGVIERACLGSDRSQASRGLCGCIQQVADVTLTRRDQRVAARFFKDPHRSQEIRQSDNPNDELFWRKYRSFGTTAENYCS
ncbi:hypothetical protein [Palleronia sp. LCG004]|uniref:hypothetical protein n=1 Tax=Palleronia sp. LCG004 TaxID=3079304 RepID=UPI0029431C19|nr:hypothetical protein [Palleronia sp. LCG004]WOI56955.1 hypothetical protein RVY76_03925 [Palleronia sp. LCG004]